MSASTPPTSGRPFGQLVIFLTLSLIAVLILGLVGVEAYARHRVKVCMSDQFQGASVDIGLAAKPMLLQLADHQLPYVRVMATGDGSELPPLGVPKGMQIDAHVERVTLLADGSGPSQLDSSTAEVSWNSDGLLETIQQQTIPGLVTSLTLDRSGTLTFGIGPEVMRAHVSLNVRVVDDKLEAKTTDVAVPFADLLASLFHTDRNSMVDGLLEGTLTALNQYPLDMHPTSVQTTPDGLALHLVGGAFTFPGAASAPALAGAQSNGSGSPAVGSDTTPTRELPASCRVWGSA